MRSINVKRVFAFATVLLLLRVLVTAVLAGIWPDPGVGSRLFLYYSIEYLLDTTVVACVIARLVIVQATAPSIHAITVVLVEQLLGALLHSATLGNRPSSPLWLIDYMTLAVAVVLGIFFGLRVRRGAAPTIKV